MTIQGAVIPAAEIDKVLELLRQRHRSHLRPGDVLELDGVVTHGEATVSLTLRDPEGTQVLTLETRCDLVDNDIQNPIDGKMACFDLLELALTQYLESGRQWRPGVGWGPEACEDVTVCMRGSVRNLKVEAMADAWLEEHG